MTRAFRNLKVTYVFREKRLFYACAGNLVLSRDLLDMKEGEEFFYHAGRIMELVGKPNVADFVPWLRWLDPQGIQRGMAEHIGRALEIVGGLVKARVAERENGVRCGDEKKKDLLDVLLEFEGNGVDEPHKLSFDTINKVIVVSESVRFISNSAKLYRIYQPYISFTFA